MANVRVQYFGSIRAAAGTPEEETARGENATVFQLLLELADAYGKAFRGEILDESGERLRDDVTLTVNGAIINHSAAYEMRLRPGDLLALFPIFPGGG
ncbi:MAG: MoaD/ThiS family protein [Oscillospiraceae bacterium]|nr:MoaD/ThiS family protein [Oscillospiraceae bacterium]